MYYNHHQLIQKLSIKTPDKFLVDQYLLEIAKAFKVNWSLLSDESNQRDVKSVALEHSVPAPIGFPSQLPIQDSLSQSSNQQPSEVPLIVDPDFDELEKRFEALKKGNKSFNPS